MEQFYEKYKKLFDEKSDSDNEVYYLMENMLEEFVYNIKHNKFVCENCNSARIKLKDGK